MGWGGAPVMALEEGVHPGVRQGRVSPLSVSPERLWPRQPRVPASEPVPGCPSVWGRGGAQPGSTAGCSCGAGPARGLEPGSDAGPIGLSWPRWRK